MDEGSLYRFSFGRSRRCRERYRSKVSPRTKLPPVMSNNAGLRPRNVATRPEASAAAWARSALPDPLPFLQPFQQPLLLRQRTGLLYFCFQLGELFLVAWCHAVELTNVTHDVTEVILMQIGELFTP